MEVLMHGPTAHAQPFLSSAALSMHWLVAWAFNVLPQAQMLRVSNSAYRRLPTLARDGVVKETDCGSDICPAQVLEVLSPEHVPDRPL